MNKHGFLTLWAVTLMLTGCGAFGGGSNRQGNAIEKAFLQAMVPHHQMAIDMAEMALTDAQLAEIKAMAQDVIDAQTGEITQMGTIHTRLFNSTLVPDEMAHAELGLTMAEAGMDMNMDDLMGANPFDREFIDMMIHHHQGAIRMARVLRKNSPDAELLTLANAIITAQSAEIIDMNALRLAEYGAESPEGGVPPE